MPTQSAEVITPVAENKYEGHESSVDFLSKIAAEEFDVILSPTTISNWKQALRAIYEVDNVFDADDTAIKQAAMGELKYIFDGGPRPETIGLHEEAEVESTKLRGMVSDSQAHNFLVKGLQVISISQSMRGIQSPRELARMTALEGQLTTTMLVHLVNPEDTWQSSYNDFIRFLRVGSRVGNVIDSIGDLKTDYEQGITSVRPTLANRLAMTWDVLPHALKAVRKLGLLATLSRMPSPAISIIKDRLRTPDS